MEARIYFKRKSAIRRLDKARIKFDIDPKTDEFSFRLGDVRIKSDEAEKDLAYAAFTSLLNLRIPRIFNGLSVNKVTIYDTLLKEENSHIKQGKGKEGKAHWMISYGDDKFNPPINSSSIFSPEAFRSVIRIRIHGKNIDSCESCYDKIRRGDVRFTWKGDIEIPSHCGVKDKVNFTEEY